MFDTSEYENRAAPRLARRLGLAAVVICCWTGHAAGDDAPATSTAPIKIAVFPFELEDFSAAREHGSSPVVTSYLARSTEEAKQQLLQSGRYRPIDTAGADIGAAKGQGLRNCRGCEAAIAKKLGADQALIGVVTKISMTEYAVRIQVSDAQRGEVISSLTTDLRMGTSDSWFRGTRWVMKNRMLASK
jgi:hypothetical protein